MTSAKGPPAGGIWSRRGFMASMAAGGFALAVQPVSAQTITTDAKGLEAGEVEMPDRPTARSRPIRRCRQSGGPFPMVLVVQEIFGVHEHIRDICRRLAKLGYFAVAPELFARQGDVRRSDFQRIIKKVVCKVPDAQVMCDLDATLGWCQSARQGRQRLRLASPDSAGAGASSGCTPRTTRT